MTNSEDIKATVKQKYGAIAAASKSCCCSCEPKADIGLEIMKDEYTGIDGYVKEADLGLGCGLPTQFADIKPGDTVVDLGAGAGNDVFVARRIVGEIGRVIGLDFTPEMIARASINKSKLGYANVEFLLGEIENIPLPEDTADVVVSNCVLNLVPDKKKAFSEMYRIMKTGGHFCISDIVFTGELSDDLRVSAALYAGCISGALPREEYINLLHEAGFSNVTIRKEKVIELPEELLLQHLSPQGLTDYKEKIQGIFSITVTGSK